MNRINLVGTNATLLRILELESTRLGLSPTVSSTPRDGFPAYLVDYDTCEDLPPTAPVILLSRTEEEELPETVAARVTSFLSNPFLLDELRWALTHLSSAVQAPAPLPERVTVRRIRSRRDAETVRLILNPEKRTASVSGSDPIRLSETEYKLLSLLREHKNQPVSAEQAATVLGSSDANKYHVYICYLRRKLERGTLRLIRTVRGQGYMLRIK